MVIDFDQCKGAIVDLDQCGLIVASSSWCNSMLASLNRYKKVNANHGHCKGVIIVFGWYRIAIDTKRQLLTEVDIVCKSIQSNTIGMP